MKNLVISRPWQGTAVGVLNAIGIGFGFIGLILLFLGGSLIAGLMESSGMAVMAGLGTTVLAIILLPFLILGIFVTIGLFKGQMWAVIIALIFTGLGLIGNITTFNLVGLLFNAFFIYCFITCMKDPYYKK